MNLIKFFHSIRLFPKCGAWMIEKRPNYQEEDLDEWETVGSHICYRWKYHDGLHRCHCGKIFHT